MYQVQESLVAAGWPVSMYFKERRVGFTEGATGRKVSRVYLTFHAGLEQYVFTITVTACL